MTEDERAAAMAAWLATRPECVRRLAAEFPPGTRLECRGRVLHVVGWTEQGSLVVCEPDPAEDWDAAMAAKEYVCAAHYRACDHTAGEG